ncbi:sporulation-delaying protein SdpB family protein [Paenibacillus sp. NPDC057934]|uniref:sporulation-delaying protein SdpB family protein n=1 Tax=Paenibacillus sp. NPDC057934 TaxID=3346282 RepID=UPI0036D9F7E2
MLNKLSNLIYIHTFNSKPWTNVYGLARTIIALSTLITLLVTDIYTFFRPLAGISEYPNCSVYSISIFCVLPKEYLPIIKWVVIALLGLIASGWRPRFTGIIHWWIATSLQNTGTTLDGGEQVAATITFLLLPVTFFDNRKWHWQQKQYTNSTLEEHSKIVSNIFLYGIKVQMAIIYFNAAIARLVNPEWIDGTAVYYYFNNAMLGLNDTLLRLLNPILTSPLVFFVTWMTTIVEIVLGAALLAPIKHYKIYFYIGAILHVGIALLLGLYSFSSIMIAGLILSFRATENEYQFFNNSIRNDKKRLLHSSQ